MASATEKNPDLFPIGKNTSGKNLNLQYSLELIEASLEYLSNIEEKNTSEEKANETIEVFSHLKDEPNHFTYSKEMLKELLRDHERLISELRKNAIAFQKKGFNKVTNVVSHIIKEHQHIACELRRQF